MKTRMHQPKSFFYNKLWEGFKQFPKSLYLGSKKAPETSKEAALALLSASLACFFMMISHHLAETSVLTDIHIQNLGNLILNPNYYNFLKGSLGSFFGKEIIMFLSWLLSWILLSIYFRNKSIKTKSFFFVFFVLMIAATVMSWHPLFPYLPLS